MPGILKMYFQNRLHTLKIFLQNRQHTLASVFRPAVIATRDELLLATAYTLVPAHMQSVVRRR